MCSRESGTREGSLGGSPGLREGGLWPVVGTDGKCLWRAVWWGFSGEGGPRRRLGQTGEALKDLLRHLESREAGLEHCLRSLEMTVSRVCDLGFIRGDRKPSGRRCSGLCEQP